MQAATANPPRTSVNHKHISGRAHEQEGGRNVLGRETAAKNARREVFVNAMSAAVTGVNLITTDGRAGRFGVTVSAMCSVSADPPILLACVNRRSPARVTGVGELGLGPLFRHGHLLVIERLGQM